MANMTPHPDHQYRVTLCANCKHPGGRHPGLACDLCNCTTWTEGEDGWWTDRMTELAETGRLGPLRMTPGRRAAVERARKARR